MLVLGEAGAAERLPTLGAQREVTVSGVSSGAYMAVQMHVAHSAIVKGAGAIAGGPYYCARGSLWTAYYNCMTPGAWTPLPALALLEADARGLARAGSIDPLANLAGAPVWLFSGTRDRTVLPEVVRALDNWYRAFKARTLLVADKPAGHAMVVEQAKNACDATQPPFVNDCDYDAAGELLRHLLGPLQPPAPARSGRLVAFDQDFFAGGDALAVSLDASGWLYVPKSCEGGGCRVHVAFHGCQQGHEKVGDAFIAGAGYNRWADANRLLILYPQAVARDGWSVRSFSFVWNPKGCWDWWGYAGAGYATKQGAQIRAVEAMLERLSEKPER